MEKTAQQSLIDMLIQLMPALQDVRSRLLNKSDPAHASLYSMWDGVNKSASRRFLKPSNISNMELKKMESAGLVQDEGKYIKITEKGAEAIKVMILNDNSFALSKKASSSKNLGWYTKLKHEDYLS